MDLDTIVEAAEGAAMVSAEGMEILRQINDDSISVKKAAEVISLSPTISAQVLRVANSPAYAPRPQCFDSLMPAVYHLGLSTVREIVIPICLSEKAKEDDALAEYFARSRVLGAAARDISARYRLGSPGSSEVAGLLADYGDLLLSVCFPEASSIALMKMKSRGLVRESGAKAREYLEVEASIFGHSHVDVGVRLFEKWRFPASIIDAIRFHHDIKGAKATGGPALAVALAVAGRDLYENRQSSEGAPKPVQSAGVLAEAESIYMRVAEGEVGDSIILAAS